MSDSPDFDDALAAWDEEQAPDGEADDTEAVEADESSTIEIPKELSGPNADVALDAMRQQHESIMNALRNIRA